MDRCRYVALFAACCLIVPVSLQAECPVFDDAQVYDVGSGVWFLLVVDLNGDPHPDIAATNLTSDSLAVLLGTGDTGSSEGLFELPLRFPTGNDPIHLTSSPAREGGISSSRFPFAQVRT